MALQLGKDFTQNIKPLHYKLPMCVNSVDNLCKLSDIPLAEK